MKNFGTEINHDDGYCDGCGARLPFPEDGPDCSTCLGEQSRRFAVSREKETRNIGTN
jgi:predicted amidophosphoribosyltransferase